MSSNCEALLAKRRYHDLDGAKWNIITTSTNASLHQNNEKSAKTPDKCRHLKKDAAVEGVVSPRLSLDVYQKARTRRLNRKQQYCLIPPKKENNGTSSDMSDKFNMCRSTSAAAGCSLLPDPQLD